MCIRDRFIDSVTKLNSLVSLDISKNKFSIENLNLLLSSLRKLDNLTTLSMSQVNLTDASATQFVNCIKVMPKIKKLNLAGNSALSHESMNMIIQGLTNFLPELQEIDLSKTQIDSIACFRQLAAMIG